MGEKRIDDAEIVTVLFGHRPSAYRARRNLELWDEVPKPFRLVHLTRKSVPSEHFAAFGYYHDKIGDAHFDGLPIEMQREIAWAVWSTVAAGGTVAVGPLGLLARELAATTERLRLGATPYRSLMDRSPHDWERELAKTWVLRTGALANQATFRTYTAVLFRMCKLLWFAYDDGPWWTREIWDLRLDPRIPRREHEPYLEATAHWHRIAQPWLRRAAMWHAKTMLETGRLSWSTIYGRGVDLAHFSRFLQARNITEPELATNHREIRPLMLDYLDELRSAPITRGSINVGRRRSEASVAHAISAVRQLYHFLHEHHEDVARALDEPRWERLGPEHARLYRDGDFPGRRGRRPFDERHLISDEVLAKVNANIHMLGAPVEEGGCGDPQAMRILLLLIATGRRVSEIRMLDLYPLVPVVGGTGSEADGVIAKLRYQQTKIDGAPDTIFVGPEVVAIIDEQRQWLADHMASIGSADRTPGYLFVRVVNNRHGHYAYDAGRLRQSLGRLVELCDLRGDDGELLPLGQTHRWRHTKATSLINAGVPLHVVQRYMGHTTPEMTMHYAQTLDATAKSEFLRYRKLTHTGAPAAISGDDLYDLMALENRTDRILPNGWCALPPAKTCEKGNACLTCELFVTDERFRSTHEVESVNLGMLIERRQADHQRRTGSEMTEEHVWLRQRRREQVALSQILASIDHAEELGKTGPIRGAGVGARAASDQRAGGAIGR